MPTDFDNMEMNELESLLQSLQAQKDELRQQMIEVKRALSKKRTAQSVAAMIERMSDAERAALHQVVSVNPAKMTGAGKGAGNG